MHDVFAVKFYAKKDRHSEYKYSKIINRGDLGNILITCAKVVPLLLKDYPAASFGFIGSRTVDISSKTVENIERNQRFKIYSYLVKKKIGQKTFSHFEYPAISGYLLVNRSCPDIRDREQDIVQMLRATYRNVPDVV